MSNPFKLAWELIAPAKNQGVLNENKQSTNMKYAQYAQHTKKMCSVDVCEAYNTKGKLTEFVT